MIIKLSPVALACAQLVGGLYHCEPQVALYRYNWSLTAARQAGLRLRVLN